MAQLKTNGRCDCLVETRGNDPVAILYCARHKAAPALLEAVELAIAGMPDISLNYLHRKLSKARAAAKGEET